MQVWERFFENAFKNLGNEYLDLDENLMYDDMGAKQAAKTLKNEYNLTKLPNENSHSKSSSSTKSNYSSSRGYVSDDDYAAAAISCYG